MSCLLNENFIEMSTKELLSVNGGCSNTTKLPWQWYDFVIGVSGSCTGSSGGHVSPPLIEKYAPPVAVGTSYGFTKKEVYF